MSEELNQVYLLGQHHIQVEAIGDSVMLTGNVATATEAQTAFDICTRLLGAGSASVTAEGSKIVNAITVHGHDHATAWSSKLPIADLKSFWGALGCACWAV